MTAELISVGTEILMGNILNSNVQYLAEKCAMLGFNLHYQVTVDDNFDRLSGTIRTALDRADLVILTGGLGPAKDDLTKEAFAHVMGLPLVEDAHTRERIKDYFRNNICREIPENNRKMATVPQGAVVLDNPKGIVPGLIVEREGETAILLPDSPGELYPLFEEQVMPYLQGLCGLAPVPCTSKLCGRGERIYTEDEKNTLEMALIRLLQEENLTISTAESCTGGMVSARLVNVPGASSVFMQGMVTYSNEAKMKLLGVKEETLRQYGAVSAQTAREMAEGGRKVAGTDLCISITGLAGPGGGSAEKPVGLVFMACCLKGVTRVKRWQFKGNREMIREQSVMNAMDLARQLVLDARCLGIEALKTKEEEGQPG